VARARLVIAVSSIRLRSGRSLAYAEWGDPSGRPVLHFHGIPGSRLERNTDDGLYARLGLRYITIDRPGYGRSDPEPGRSFIDWSSDVEQLADALGIDRFPIVAVSGGGPFALAVARELPSRVERVAIVSGVGPSDRPGALEGIGMTERFTYWAAPRYPRATAAATSAFFRSIARGSEVFASLAERSGRSITPHVENARLMSEQFREAFRQGGRATVVENAMCARPWGFSLEEVEPFVQLWHGDRDRVCPLHHAEYLASVLPHVTLTVGRGGHLLVVGCIEDTLRALIA
jgi:pimeloyl-ACP methyl ester carboxylesterase